MAKKDFKKSKKGMHREQSEFDQKIIDLARVTRVMAGGKRMRFRACVAIGNKKGKVGIGLAKGADVTIAVNKAVNRAKKNTVIIPFVNETIPHEVRIKYKAGKLLLKPAPKGTGIKAGGAVRVVLELGGVPNIVGKILGTNNKVTNVKALMEAIKMMKTPKNTNNQSSNSNNQSNRKDQNAKPQIKKEKGNNKPEAKKNEQKKTVKSEDKKEV